MNSGVDLEKLPMRYMCLGCDAAGVKLWRPYQCITIDRCTLKCRACAEAEQGEGLSGDAIGWMVPAVPDDTGTFWGYTSVPEPAVQWWRALPELDARKQGEP